ncbi:hypothetical protein UlMin_000766 [Ulmus minor]
MAETFLSPVIGNLIELLNEEVVSLSGVHEEIQRLKDELEIIHFLLKDADAKSKRGSLGDAVKVWMDQVREAADDIEATIVEYRRQFGPHQRGFIGFFRQIVHRIKAMRSCYVIASEIRKINETLRRIKDTGQGYGLNNQSFSLHCSTSRGTYVDPCDPRLASHFIEEDEFVDASFLREDLLRSLTEGTSWRQMISLVGEGGIGKTTLARMVFNHQEVEKQFDCRAWITVSQAYNMKDVLKKMIREISPTLAFALGDQDRTVEELVHSLRQYLQMKRYAIVFDDIWDTDFWENIKYALPSNNNGSRIIITTRNSDIATSCKEHPCDRIQNLQIWSSELALELFCKRAFRFEADKCCPEELQELSLEIVSKCQGLPLVIAAMAGLLSTKTKIWFEWQRVLDNLDSEFETNPQLTKVSRILSLSYHDLPHHLKLCFLYFGVFPGNDLIRQKRIQNLWIAEGFVEIKKDKTLEEVAEAYLNELINRNLVSFELDDDVGLRKWCYVHDLMRDVIRLRANELFFSQTIDESGLKFGIRSHRLSILGRIQKALEHVEDRGVRSVFLFNINELRESSLVTLCEKVKLLKVLDLSDAPLDILPKEVGNLIRLKYLCLRGTQIKMIPKSIGKLYCLQYFNISKTSVQSLPKSIGKLQNLQCLILHNTRVRELPVKINKFPNLRRLIFFDFEEGFDYGRNTCIGLKIKGEVGHLQSLETISLVEDPDGDSLIKDLDKLRNLRELGISKLTRKGGRDLGASIGKMNNLVHLELQAMEEDEILDLQSISPPTSLHRLFLSGRLEKFPDWFSNLWSLQSLNLCFSRSTDNPLKYLKGLPSLMNLKLIHAYDGKELHFELGDFQKLKALNLTSLHGLEVIKMDREALPFVEKFRIGHCPLLKELPSGIKHLTNLKLLEFRDMPSEFVACLQPAGGRDYSKIKHVPSVIFNHKKEGTDDYIIYKLGESNLLEDNLQG